jgi:hypothetical protein
MDSGLFSGRKLPVERTSFSGVAGMFFSRTVRIPVVMPLVARTFVGVARTRFLIGVSAVAFWFLVQVVTHAGIHYIIIGFINVFFVVTQCYPSFICFKKKRQASFYYQNMRGYKTGYRTSVELEKNTHLPIVSSFPKRAYINYRCYGREEILCQKRLCLLTIYSFTL